MSAAAQGEATPPGALAGVRVLDLTRVLAGPYATLVLADLGAEVLKVEDIKGGDDSRSFAPPEVQGISTYFLSVNRNKKSIAIDLKTERGRALFLDLAAKADVVVENFRSGVVDRLGIDYASVRARNPGIIYCSISGYGRSGSRATDAGYDPVAQAESGLMSLTGDADGPGHRFGVSLVDMVCGLFAAQSITAAIHHRSRGGDGQYLEVCLFDTALNMLVNFAGSYLLTGAVPGRSGSGSALARPSGPYQAADGPFMLTVGSQKLWQVFCEQVIEQPQLKDDPRFATNRLRIGNAGELDRALNTLFAKRPRGEWLERMRVHGIPAGPINTVGEALSDPLVAERELIGRVQHSLLGELPALRSPMRLGATPAAPLRAAPLLGEHGRAVLADWLALGEDEIDGLERASVIAANPPAPLAPRP